MSAEETGAVFLNTDQGHDGILLLGAGIHIKAPDISSACKDFIEQVKVVEYNRERLRTGELSFERDPLDAVDTLVASQNEVILQKIEGHPRARYALYSRKKTPRLTGKQLTKIESCFPTLSPDDVILWKMRLRAGTQSQLVYAGVALYGESHTKANDPSYDPGA